MINKYILMALACWMVLTASASSLTTKVQGDKYQVNVDVNPKMMMGFGGGMVSLLVSSENGVRVVTTSKLVEGKALFEGCVSRDSLAYIQFGDNEKFRIPFVLEKGHVIVDQKGNVIQAHGTLLNDRLNAFYSDESVSWKDSAAYVRKSADFIAQNHDNSLAAMLFLGSMYVKDNDLNVTETYWKLLSPRVQALAEVANLYQRVVANSKCYEGMKLKDVELLEGNTAAKKVRLSDYVGKGKYVLVDLWASWCSACRMGIPNVKAAYAAYTSKGLDCVSITVWDKRDRALNAIKEEAMPWTQLMDENGGMGTSYGFNSIPRLYLFSPDGHLLKKDIPNNKLLEVLEQVFGNK